MLQKAGVAAGSSLDIGELVRDPHVVKRGAIIQQNHPVGGDQCLARPWKSALTAKNPPAPCLGQHNDYVFKTLLGMSDSEVARLKREKVYY